jgi:hypothetical protein
MHFTKLFNSILDSTIWQESKETKLVWITMLAMCDKSGEIHAAIPGLAARAGVTIDECEKALECLKSEDKYSRTKVENGRRISEIDGGWALINHGKYRALLSVEERREYLAQKQREHRAKTRKQPSTDVGDKSTKSTHTEAEADTEAIKERENANPILETRSKAFFATWTRWKLHCMDKGKTIHKTTEETQLQQLGSAYPDELEAIKAIEYAIAKNWANVSLSGDHNKPPDATKWKPKTAVDTEDLVKKQLAAIKEGK